MSEEEILARLKTGFLVDGRPFAPLAYLRQVDEPLYGCEERTSEEVYGLITGYTAQGPAKWPIEEKELNACGLDDDMWVGWLQVPGGRRLVCWQPKKASLLPARPGPWLALFGA